MADETKQAVMDAGSADAATLAAANNAAMKWYVVQVYSGFEQKVKLSLLEQIKQKGLEGSFGEILIPTETGQDNQGGRRVSSKTFYPRLHLRADGHDRRGVARRARHAEGHGFRRWS